MELRHLRYLVAVAEEGSFVAAAARLNVAQPALSRQIRDLESCLGTELFTREPTGVRLTAAGEQCVQSARRILGDVSAAVKRARLAERGLIGKCIIGAGRYPIWNGLLPRMMAQARADYPGIEVVVEEFSDETQWNALAEARVDIAFGSAPPPDQRFVAETHSLDVIDGIVVSRSHHLSSRARLTLHELEPETMIRFAPPVEDEASRSLTLVLQRLGFSPATQRVAANADALRLMVRSGAGWSPLPRSLRGGLNTGLVAIPLEDLAVPFRYVHMHRRGDTRPAVQSILRSMRRCAGRETPGALPAEPPSGIRSIAASDAPANLSRLELRHFRYFAAIVQYESIGRAAEALELTQPALSRQLRDLESEVGTALLTRTARGVLLTRAGEALHADAMLILAAADRMASEALRAVRGTAGDCVVGVVPSPMVWEIVTAAVSDCAARHPLIEIRIEDVPTPRQDAALREARIDVGLCHRYPTVSSVAPNVARDQLLEDSMCMALVSEHHPLAAREDVALSELADLPFLFMKRAFSPGLWDFVMGTFARAGFTPRIEGEHDGLPTVWALTAQGLGWCLGAGSQAAAPPAGVRAVRIRDLDIPWGCELVYRRDESRLPVLSVLATLRQAAARIRAGMASQENKYWSHNEASA